MARHWDVLVVGGGVLGVALSLVARELGRTVLVVRLRDDERPEADTLRAHGVLHSGLLYASTNRALARQIRYQGQRLLARAGMRLPSERGVYVLGSEEHAEHFEASAADLKLSSQIRRLSDAELRRRLGPFHSPGFPGYEVPDAPFPSGDLLDDLRDVARDAGATFIEVDEEIRLRPDPSQENGFICTSSGRPFSASNVILAAGVRLPGLLDDLKIVHPLAVSRTPVLRVEGGSALSAPLLADLRTLAPSGDRSAPLFITRYSSSDVPPAGCLVLAGSRKPLAKAEATHRVVEQDQQDFLEARLPPQYSRSPRRWWAGHKVEPVGSYADHWVLKPSEHEYRNLFAAIPGKATMALSIAEDVFQLMESEVITADSNPVVQSDEIHGIEWTEPVRMMHDNYYNDVDEGDRSRSGID